MENEKNGKWTPIFHLLFTMKRMKNEKWTPISVSIFDRKWKMENGYPFSIFHFPFAMEN